MGQENTVLDAWLEPWDKLAEESKKTFQNQLQQEVTPLHPLHNIPTQPIGKNGGTDDVLFELPDQRFAVVHLSWTGQGDSCIVPKDSGISLPPAYRANLWENYHMGAPAQRRQLGALSSKVQKAYKS